MGIGKNIRGCDKFGAHVNLMHEGESSSGMLCGGVASLSLGILILAYFCMRLLAVTQFDDPVINSYMIGEDRDKMNTPISFGGYS